MRNIQSYMNIPCRMRSAQVLEHIRTWAWGLSSAGRGPQDLPLPVKYPPSPLRKHQESQESDGQTGSWSLDKAVLARDVWYQAVTALVMVEKHTKTKSSGVQYQAECCDEQEDSSRA